MGHLYIAAYGEAVDTYEHHYAIIHSAVRLPLPPPSNNTQQRHQVAVYQIIDRDPNDPLSDFRKWINYHRTDAYLESNQFIVGLIYLGETFMDSTMLNNYMHNAPIVETMAGCE